MNIQPTYVTFEQAKLLKEKGFNMDIKSNLYQTEKAVYKENEKLIINQNSRGGSICMFEGIYAAPEQHQVIEWLRINHGINVLPIENYRYPDNIIERWKYQIVNNQEKDRDIFNKKFYIESDFEFNSPQEAYSAAFDYILAELI